MIVTWKRLGNASLSCRKCRKFSWDEEKANIGACWVMLTFVVWAKDLTLGLGLKAKRIRGAIWGLIVSEVVIAKLDVIAGPEQVVTGSETGQVVTALKREKAHEMSNILLLESEENIKEREETLLYLLCFILETRVKVTSSASGTSTAISISEEDVRKRLELYIVLIASTSIRLKWDFKAVSPSFRNCLKKISDIRSNSQDGRKLFNRLFFKKVLFYKACKTLKE